MGDEMTRTSLSGQVGNFTGLPVVEDETLTPWEMYYADLGSNTQPYLVVGAIRWLHWRLWLEQQRAEAQAVIERMCADAWLAYAKPKVWPPSSDRIRAELALALQIHRPGFRGPGGLT